MFTRILILKFSCAAITKGEVERIYELKNYQYIKLDEMRAADELELLQKELEHQKINTKLSSSKP